MSGEARALPEVTSSTLYFGPWYRKSPFFEATLRWGCTAYDVYNHMYLPAHYDDLAAEYWALVNDVTLWDVAVERVVQISGPDGFALTNALTCRDLTRCAAGQGKYAPIIAPDGGIINDPVLLRRDENTFWLCLADSDAYLYAMGLAHGLGLKASVSLPEAYPVQVQGPKAKAVMAELAGDAVLGVKYYWTLDTAIAGIPVVVSRKLVGIEAPGDPTFFELTEARPALAGGQRIGRVTDLVWSPRLQRNIGYVWVPAGLAGPGNDLEIEWNDGQRTPAKTAAIPFLDPHKHLPTT